MAILDSRVTSKQNILERVSLIILGLTPILFFCGGMIISDRIFIDAVLASFLYSLLPTLFVFLVFFLANRIIKSVSMGWTLYSMFLLMTLLFFYILPVMDK
jgi:hypothetical protein